MVETKLEGEDGECRTHREAGNIINIVIIIIIIILSTWLQQVIKPDVFVQRRFVSCLRSQLQVYSSDG